MGSLVGNTTVTGVKIFDKADCISLRKTWEGLNPLILPPAMGK